MLPDDVMTIAQQAMRVVALVSAPILLPALIVGVVLGMVQAATSINEATLSFVPKLAAIGLCLVLFGAAMLAVLVDFTHELYARIPEITR